MVTCEVVSLGAWRWGMGGEIGMEAYAVAVVPEVEDLEGDGGLRALAGLEVGAGVEGC